ncbi:glycosyltransferase [Candidatus Saccharibacteria bacterium]|nr:glycosyltransferase [Candidatus Saccharibacteria bacterium]
MKINLEPWKIPSEERKAIAKNAKKAGKKVALMLYPSPDASTFRYRGYNTFCATKKSEKWQLIYFFLDEIEILKSLIPDSDILIFSRLNHWDYVLDDLAMLAHNYGLPILNDLDDCVCGLKHVKQMFNTVSPDLIDRDYWINTCANFELVSYAADGFIATNEYLGKLLSNDHDKKPYFVIQNSLNKEQIEYSEFLVRKKHHQKKQKNFTLGYFSGSATHAVDLGVIYPEILQLLADFPDIRLRIVGEMHLPESATPFIKRGQIEFYPIVDFMELQRLISEVDVNLAPLADNIFTNCKSELKYFEAAIVETPTIASPTFTFETSIKNGKTGFLCQPGEWYDAILELYKNRGLNNEVVRAAKAACLKEYSPETMTEKIDKVFDEILKRFKK